MSERMGGLVAAAVEQDTFLPDGDDFFDAYMSSREATADKSETHEPMTWEDKLNALEQRYGGRVFTYKQYSGTVRDLIACPHFSLQLEDGVESAANWLETHDGTLEDVVEEDENENEDKEEPQNNIEENQPKSEPERPVAKEVEPEVKHKPEPVVAARERTEEPVVETIAVEIEPETRAAAPAEVVTIESVREDVARQETHDTASVDLAALEEITIPLPVRDEVEVHIDLGRRAEKNPDMQVEDAGTEERETGGMDETILQPEILLDTEDSEPVSSRELSEITAGDEHPEVDFYAPTVVFDGEAEQDDELINAAETVLSSVSEESDEIEKELMNVTETVNDEAAQPEESGNAADVPAFEPMYRELDSSPIEHVLENELAGEEARNSTTEQAAEIMQIEEIVRLVEFVGEQPAGEAAASTKELHGRAMLLVAKIETLEQAKTAEACREAIAEIREELTALLLLMGYANANELAERLIRQYDIRQLKKHMIAIVRALSSPEHVVPSNPFHVRVPLWHKCGIHVVGMVTRLRAA